MEKNRTATFIFIHQARVLEVSHKCHLSLDSSVSQGSNFFTVEFLPFFPVECLHNSLNQFIDIQAYNKLTIFKTLSNLIRQKDSKP